MPTRRAGKGVARRAPRKPEPGKSPVKRRAAGKATRRFEVGDHVTWNSEAGWVSGRIVKVHTSDVDYQGYLHHASPDAPQYAIKSDKTDHVALHKGTALKLTRR
jgi:hypothetical protein